MAISAGAGALGEQFGVAGEMEAGEFPAFLGDGGGDDGIDQLSVGGFDGVEAEAHGRFAAHFAGGADGGAEHGILVVIDDDDIVRIVAEAAVELVAPPEDVELGDVGGVMEQLVHSVDDEMGLVAEDGVGQGLDDDLGADAGGVAHGDRDGGAIVHSQSPCRLKSAGRLYFIRRIGSRRQADLSAQ